MDEFTGPKNQPPPSHHEERGGRGGGRETKKGACHQERRGNEERERETKMSGSCREEPLGEGQSSSWAGKFRVRGRVYQVRTKGCRESLEARSALVCEICISIFCPGI
jgi:hypothetical protein